MEVFNVAQRGQTNYWLYTTRNRKYNAILSRFAAWLKACHLKHLCKKISCWCRPANVEGHVKQTFESCDVI